MTPIATPVREMPGASGLTPDRFKAECASAGGPVVFRGLLRDWAALEWKPDQLAGRWPDRPVRAFSVTPDGVTLRTLKLTKQALVRDLADAQASLRSWYFDVLGDLPEVVQDCPPDAVMRGRVDYMALFIGCDTVTCTHFHERENSALCQVHGTKRVVLLPPADRKHLYPYPVFHRLYNVSRVDWDARDVRRFPKLSATRPLEVTLEPRDVLFIPIHWWHMARGVGAGISIGLFWDGTLREQLSPGLRTLVGRSLSRGRSWLERSKA